MIAPENLTSSAPVLWQKRYASEFVGTFGIVFAPVALSASGHLAGGDATLAAASWVSGLIVLCMIAALGPIGAAHFNPAVTLAFAVAGRFSRRHIGPYVTAQMLGGIAAAAMVRVLFGDAAPFGTHHFSGSVMQAVGMEAILTFFLMLVILAVATDKRTPGVMAPLAIGLVVVLDVWIGGAVTGGSMNPARSFGPALIFGGAALSALPVYLIAPPVGATIAAWLYEKVLRTHPEHACPAPE